MVILLTRESFPLTAAEVNVLWKSTIKYRSFSDEDVAVQCVDESEMRHLNKTYRDHDAVTNVLTFTYEADPKEFPQASQAEHDVVVCLSVADREAKERNIQYRDYVALLLVHAFLHVTHMDHECSQAESKATRQAEVDILQSAGFSHASL